MCNFEVSESPSPSTINRFIIEEVGEDGVLERMSLFVVLLELFVSMLMIGFEPMCVLNMNLYSQDL